MPVTFESIPSTDLQSDGIAADTLGLFVGPDYGDEVEYLRVFVNQLRKKIEPDPSNPQYLLTEPWVGYRLASEPAAAGL